MTMNPQGFGLLGSLAGQVVDYADQGNTVGGDALQSGLQYAGMGASLGSVVPGIGTLVGGLAGGAVGLATGGIEAIKRKRKMQQLQQQNSRFQQRMTDMDYMNKGNIDPYGLGLQQRLY